MNNGDGQNNSQFPVNELVPFQPNTPISPEVYSVTMQRIQDMRNALSSYEERANAGFKKYLDEKQKLEAVVEQGRLAAQKLAELETVNPTSPEAGPSTTQQPLHPSHGQFQAYHTQNYNEVPSSARIVEVPSSQGLPQVERRSSAGASSSRSEHHPTPQNRPQGPTAPYDARKNNAYSTPSPFAPQYAQDWTAFGASPSVLYNTGAHQQHASYQGGQWTTPGSFQHWQQAYQFVPHTQAPPLGPSISRSSQQGRYAAPQQAGGVPQAGHVASATSHPTGGAAGPSSSSSFTRAQADGTNRSNVAQNSEDGSRNGQTPTSTSAQHHSSQPTGIPEDRQRQLFLFFQRLSAPTVQRVMVQILIAVDRKRQGREKTNSEVEAEGKFEPNLLQAIETISEHMKIYSVAEIKALFSKYVSLTKNREQTAAQPAEGTSPSVEKAPPQQPAPSTSAGVPPPAAPPPPQHPAPSASNGAPPSVPLPLQHSTPSTSTGTPPSVQRLPTVQPVQPQDQSLLSSASTTAGPANAAPAPTASSSTVVSANVALSPVASTSSTIPATPMMWYKPTDPNAPMAYRNANGQLQFQWNRPPNLPQPSAPLAPSKPPAPEATPEERAMTPLPQPGLEPEQASSTAWTPEKANKTRLAQDILRSLGRPQVPENPTPTAAKRKTPPARARSPPSRTPAKRPRLDRNEEGTGVSDGPSAAAIGITVTAGTAGEPSLPALDLGVDEDEPMERVAEGALLDAPAVADADRHLHDTLPVLSDADAVLAAQSFASSVAVNVDRVEDVFGSGPRPEPRRAPSLPEVRVRLSSESTDGFDLVGPTLSSAAASNASPPPSSPAPSEVRKAKEKEKEGHKVPLFLPSPTGSPERSSRDEEDVDLRVALLLPRGKGKGKARAVDLGKHVDVDMVDGETSRKRLPRANRAYVLVPPKPVYERRVDEFASVASGSRYATPSVASASGSASGSRSRRPSTGAGGDGDEESADELADWHVDEEVGPLPVVVEPERDAEEEEAEAAAGLAFSRLRETPCAWAGCGVVLNSMETLQKHVALHAGENEEWGTFTCRWNNCLSTHFVDKQSLVRHLQKHAKSPLRCAYEGCEQSFGTASELLHHHRSGKHRDGQVRRSWHPAPRPEDGRQLSPLPESMPAYMSVVRRVVMHPIPRERHQWLGPKVLENITSFKYSGRRSNAAQPSRGRRRLAEKAAAAELGGVGAESAISQIRRWIDDEYLDFADGYDASRRYRVWCADIPSGEVTKMVDDGLVMFVEGREEEREGSGREGEGEGEGGGENWSAMANEGGADRQAAATNSQEREGGEGGQEEQQAPRGGDADGSPALQDADGRMEDEGEGGARPTIRLKLTLPRRGNVIRLPPRPSRTEAGSVNDHDVEAVATNAAGDAGGQDDVGGVRVPVPSAAPAAADLPPTSPPLVSVPEPTVGDVMGSMWTVWPAAAAKEESVELH